MPEILLSLGSNIEPLANLDLAVAKLHAEPRLRAVRESARYWSPPVGFSGPAFVNNAVHGFWDGDLPTFRQALREIEDVAGRDRSAPRLSSRTLDIDIVLFGDLISSEGSGIPRGELLERAFTLRPCAEIAPDWQHPVTGVALATHWQQWCSQHADPLRPVDADAANTEAG